MITEKSKSLSRNKAYNSNSKKDSWVDFNGRKEEGFQSERSGAMPL